MPDPWHGLKELLQWIQSRQLRQLFPPKNTIARTTFQDTLDRQHSDDNKSRIRSDTPLCVAVTSCSSFKFFCRSSFHFLPVASESAGCEGSRRFLAKMSCTGLIKSSRRQKLERAA